MSAEHDNLDLPESEVAAAEELAVRSTKVERPLSDREVARPRADAQLADAAAENDSAVLFEPNMLGQFNDRWSEIQTGFVDEPRRAVQQADALVSDVIKRIADSFGTKRSELEHQWDSGADVSTEDLRQALQRYRAFFSRLLTI